jgi:hypothetical protein
MKKYFFKTLIQVILFSSLISCTEPYALQTNTFEDAIVIEATITNELKKQEIKISRTFTLEENTPRLETNAEVYVTDDLGNQYNFEEESGKYVSASEFQATAGRQYSLFVNTSDGKQYSSSKETLTTITPLTEINANRKINFGVEGVEITANSYDPSGTSKYYRYEYEETYKIVSPYWSKDSLITYNSFPGGDIVFDTIPKNNINSKICYNTEFSKEIILENTTNYSEDRIVNFPVRFIPKNNSIIAHRYSILVKQYVQNIEAHTYYKTLKDFSGSDNVLSPNQPGFVVGNIKNINNPNEKVIGFFEVTSVSSARLFFNYTDFFTDEPNPNYPKDCELQQFNTSIPFFPCNGGGLDELGYCTKGSFGLRQVLLNKVSLFYKQELPFYYMVIPQCGECNRIWSNVVPSFWTD